MPHSSVESPGHHRRSTAVAARFAVMGVAVAAVAGASDVGTRCPAVRLCRGARIQGAHAARASKVLARDRALTVCARGAPKVISETTPPITSLIKVRGHALVRAHALGGRTPSRAASRVGNGPGDVLPLSLHRARARHCGRQGQVRARIVHGVFDPATDTKEEGFAMYEKRLQALASKNPIATTLVFNQRLENMTSNSAAQ